MKCHWKTTQHHLTHEQEKKNIEFKQKPVTIYEGITGDVFCIHNRPCQISLREAEQCSKFTWKFYKYTVWASIFLNIHFFCQPEAHIVQVE